MALKLHFVNKKSIKCMKLYAITCLSSHDGNYLRHARECGKTERERERVSYLSLLFLYFIFIKFYYIIHLFIFLEIKTLFL